MTSLLTPLRYHYRRIINSCYYDTDIRKPIRKHRWRYDIDFGPIIRVHQNFIIIQI